MQPLAGSDLPHTRSRAVHWIATAAALAAVVAGSAALAPSDATATGAGHAPASGSAGDTVPDPRAASFPLDCGRDSVSVVHQGSADLDGDGRIETVAVVRCDAAGGTPPSGIYVLGQRAGGPTVTAVFMKPDEGMSVSDFALRDGVVFATLTGYSDSSVPRCCPDLQRKVNWRWRDGKYRLTALRTPGSV